MVVQKKKKKKSTLMMVYGGDLASPSSSTTLAVSSSKAFKLGHHTYHTKLWTSSTFVLWENLSEYNKTSSEIDTTIQG